MNSELQHIHPSFVTAITPAIRIKIEKHYIQNKDKPIDRAKLAKSLGITKYQLNQAVISMGLKSKEVVDEK